MTRILLAAALTAAAFVTSAPANACTIDTCTYTKPVCDRVDCTHPVCFDLYCP
jgi:hypothetical protein